MAENDTELSTHHKHKPCGTRNKELALLTMDASLKAVKKFLQKIDDRSLNLEALRKKVLKKIGDKATSDQVKHWILASDKFTIVGKHVSLAKSWRKRKSDEVDQGYY